MSYELKPCPFCGKNTAVLDDAHNLEECPNFDDCEEAIDVSCSMHCVVCDAYGGGCGASTGYYPTVSAAIEAWNRRAERTCRMVDCSTHDTCAVNRELGNGDVMSVEFGYRQCSECGAYVFDCPTVRYCPNCGAKVVDYE